MHSHAEMQRLVFDVHTSLRAGFFATAYLCLGRLHRGSSTRSAVVSWTLNLTRYRFRIRNFAAESSVGQMRVDNRKLLMKRWLERVVHSVACRDLQAVNAAVTRWSCNVQIQRGNLKQILHRCARAKPCTVRPEFELMCPDRRLLQCWVCSECYRGGCMVGTGLN